VASQPGEFALDISVAKGGVPNPVFEGALLMALNVLPLVWLVVVIKGIKKSRWPSVILLLPVKWGMF
jgi:hypothetical protein